LSFQKKAIGNYKFKLLTNMKKKTLLFALAGSMMIFGCETERRVADQSPTERAEERTEETLEDREDRIASLRDAADDLIESASTNLRDIEISRHASENAQNDQVRDFADRVVNDKMRINTQLQSLAADKGISLPQVMDENQREDVADLREQTEEEYDQEYLDMITSSFDDEIDRLEGLAEDSEDEEIRNWAQTSLHNLNQLKDEAERLQEHVVEEDTGLFGGDQDDDEDDTGLFGGDQDDEQEMEEEQNGEEDDDTGLF
jgi:putative membrane protein